MLSANPTSFKISLIAATVLGLAALPSVARADHDNDKPAQKDHDSAKHDHDNTPNGFPLDWSHKHVHYRQAGNVDEAKKLEHDPRYLRHQYEDQHKWWKLADDDADGHGKGHGKKREPKDSLTADWAVSLGDGFVAQNMSPAKWGFSGAPNNCNDLVVFGLNANSNYTTAGAEQANLIGVNNLYGTANGCTANPNVAFAYALVGAFIVTSPVFSFYDNGAQIAFVDNEGSQTPTNAVFRVLKYSTASGNGTAAAAPVAYPIDLNFQYSMGTPDTNSSPYIDYFSDTAYVGNDDGTLYALSPVFGGGAPKLKWSVQLAAGTKLTGPVMDMANGVVLVGASNGNLYAVNAASGTQIGSPLAIGNGSAGGIVDPPVLVEEGFGLPTYVFVTTGCNVGGTNAIVYEASDTSAGLTSMTSENIGSTNSGCGTIRLHAPALDDNVYSSIAGFLYACGTTTNTGSPRPLLYSYSLLNNGSFGGTAGTPVQPPNTVNNSECSPVTYFTSNLTEKIFMGIGGPTGAFIESNTVGAGTIGGPAVGPSLEQFTTPNATEGTSGIVVDNSSGTSSLANVYFTALAPLTLGNSYGNCQSFNKTVDGSNIGNTVTLTGHTGSNLNFPVGGTIVVSGFSGGGGIGTLYNGNWKVDSVNTATNSLTYTASGLTSNVSGQNNNASWGTCAFQLTQSGLN
jgi:hypothetical protein